MAAKRNGPTPVLIDITGVGVLPKTLSLMGTMHDQTSAGVSGAAQPAVLWPCTQPEEDRPMRTDGIAREA